MYSSLTVYIAILRSETLMHRKVLEVVLGKGDSAKSLQTW